MFYDTPFMGEVGQIPLLGALLPSGGMLVGGGLLVMMLARNEQFERSGARNTMTTVGGILLTVGILRVIKVF